MKKKLRTVFGPVFVTILYTHAQNLVPDPGFELLRRVPTAKNNGVGCTKTWSTPTYGASDYYHHDAGWHSGVPRNVFGRQHPHSGEAYAGICIRTNFIEYLQCKLSANLVKDQEYLVEFYVCKAERSIGSVRQFGVLFKPGLLMGLNGTGIREQPQLIVLKKGKFANKREWTKVSGIYRAEGEERVIIVGFFPHGQKKRYRGFAHYYIDDVSVTPVITHADTSDFATRVNDPHKEVYAPETGKTITLRNIFFDINQTELLPRSFAELDLLADYLLNKPSCSIHITGHTDNTGTEALNRALSEGRARAVAEYLAARGIDETRISYKGMGSTQAVTANDTEWGRQQNRRVEFVISNE